MRFTRRALFTALPLLAPVPRLTIRALRTRKHTIDRRDYLFLHAVRFRLLRRAM